jgi:hypothetical protein
MHIARLLLIVALAVLSAGCGIIANIFKAGMIVGIIFFVVMLLIVVWIARKLTGRRRP